jgi:DNA invertase Pin-like site-specific DNA recombinase
MLFKQKKFSVAVYLRLSREDGDKTESDSIANQRLLIENYLSDKPFLQFFREYVDDGYTGSNFERPGFIKMMEDIKRQKVNCIIVKDLSRFGRNYIEVGRYIEKKFPAMGIRFIAINDQYDNAKESGDAEQIIVPFKNLINDAYCRDISIKVRSQLDVKRKNGKFIGSFAAYGYLKDPKDKNHLIVDEYAAEIVQLIFNLKLDGFSALAIAEELNKMGVLPPMEYKRMLGYNYNSGFRTSTTPSWGAKSVIRILENELYTGVMVQGKNQKINYKVKKSRAVSSEQWIRVQDTHEAIIPRTYFDRVQEIMRLDTRTAPSEKNVYPLSGLVRCGDCEQNMVRRSTAKKNKVYYYLHCSSYRNGEGCTSHIISEEKLMCAVITFVKTQLALLVEADKILQHITELPKEQYGVKALNTQIGELNREIERYCDLKERLYQDMVAEVIDKEEYAEYNQRFSLKMEETKKAKTALEEKRERLLSTDIHLRPWMEDFKRISTLETLGRKEMVMLINRVLVFSKDRIEIHLNFEDEIYEFIERAEQYREACGQEVCV